MHYLLHIDTATDTCNLAIGCNGAVVAHCSHNEARNHASAINLLIEQLLIDAGITFAQLSAVVVCAGPGSYTGLRIGMATAKGLCYALNIPLLADNRLTLLAQQSIVASNGVYAQYISLLTAREKEYFISIYDNHFTCILPPQHIMTSQLDTLIAGGQNVFIITDVAQEIINTLLVSHLENDIQISIPAWVKYAYEQFNCNSFVSLSGIEPFYLKDVYTHK